MSLGHPLRFSSVVVSLATLLLTAPLVSACSSDTTATPRVFVESRMTAGANGSATCGVTDPVWVGIGTSVQSVNDGDGQDGKTVNVNCSVTANSDGTFQVNASATLQGTGSVTINGKFSGSGQQTGIHGVFQRGDFGRFDEADCTVDYVNIEDGQANPNMGVAAGRVWGTITCPHASDPSQQRGTPPVARACEGIAELKFENCGQ